jgi:hypothetical protein
MHNELLCAAGFPLVFTRILTLGELSTPAYYGYLALYNAIYVLPLLAMVIAFVITLGTRKLKEEEGRVLKLVAGLMMVGLGSVLLLAPEALNHPLIAIALIVSALVVTALVVWFARWSRRFPERPHQPTAGGRSTTPSPSGRTH